MGVDQSIPNAPQVKEMDRHIHADARVPDGIS
jgi:hypothetical protein